MTVGAKLRQLRLKMKKTLREESEIFKVSLNTVYRWEHDLTLPRKSTLKKAAIFYGVTLEWLTHGNTKEDNNKNKCDGCTQHPENYEEQQLLYMFKKLSENNKYKILGYVEHIYVEDIRDSYH